MKKQITLEKGRIKEKGEKPMMMMKKLVKMKIIMLA